MIETERLRLERWDERHTPLLVRLASMPEVMRFIGTGDPWPPLLAEDVARAERRHWERARLRLAGDGRQGAATASASSR